MKKYFTTLIFLLVLTQPVVAQFPQQPYQSQNACGGAMTMIIHTNQARVQHGLKPVSIDWVLMWTSQLTSLLLWHYYRGQELKHSPEFATGYVLPRPGGGTVRTPGLVWDSENVSIGDGAINAVAGFKTSPPHWENILSPEWRFTGQGCEPRGPYCTQHFKEKPVSQQNSFYSNFFKWSYVYWFCFQKGGLLSTV